MVVQCFVNQFGVASEYKHWVTQQMLRIRTADCATYDAMFDETSPPIHSESSMIIIVCQQKNGYVHESQITPIDLQCTG